MSIVTQQNIMSGYPLSRQELEMKPHSPIGDDDESVDVGWDGYTYGPDTSGAPDILGVTPIDERTGPKAGSVINNGSVTDSNQYGPGLARLSNGSTTFLGVIADMLGDPTTSPNWNTEGGGGQMADTFINTSNTQSLRNATRIAGIPIASGGAPAGYDWVNTYGINNWADETGNVNDPHGTGEVDVDATFTLGEKVEAAGGEVNADGVFVVAGAGGGSAEVFGTRGSGGQTGLAKLKGMKTGSLGEQ